MTPCLYQNKYTFRHIVIYGIGLVLAACLVAYVVFQARFIIEGPLLTFSTPTHNIQNERITTISGKSENIVSLTLNGREIYTDKSGYFNEAIVLENGYTIVTLTARDRYGRERSYEQSFVYTGTQSNLTNSYGNEENKQENS